MKKLRIHYIQHVAFEGIGYIENWANKNGSILSSTHLYNGEELPKSKDFDWLIIMGGPMGVYEESAYQWLAEEKSFIKECIDADKKIIGICLGSQLLAEVLGSKVYPSPTKEIGWFPVSLVKEYGVKNILNNFPESFPVMHWHGDTFDLPKDSTRLLESVGCRNQAFLYKNRILGLQFHLESTPETLKDIVNNCRHELVSDKFVQSENEIFNKLELCETTNSLLCNILNQFKNLK